MPRTPELTICNFLDKLSSSAGGKGLSGVRILAAVSGGADSVSLLCMLHLLAPRYGYFLSAVTVDHRIRSEEESGGDARFVDALCKTLVPPVPCAVISLERGEVAREAFLRGRGVEDAARSIRYRHLEETAESIGAAFIFTGHTRNDQLETILMRFFQGAGGGALGGIAPRRGKFVRPLLDITRAEIVGWLRSAGIAWREDGTNSEDAYLRNRIRHHLVPVLDSVIPGWENGVAAVAGKALLDDDLCRSMITAEWRLSGGRVECQARDFISLHPALRIRFLQKALVLLKVEHRVPYGFLKRIVDASESWQTNGPDEELISGSHLCFRKEGGSVFLGKDIVQNSKTGYLVYIRKCGSYCFPFGTITVSGVNEVAFLDNGLGPFRLPLTVRSRIAGDTVGMADGKRKTVKKLMNDWSIPESDRNLLPLIEQAGKLCAVYGGALGYPDWYVHI